MGTPLGTIHATNISPDPENGIGNYSLADFDLAVRRGIRADGALLYPAMPYPSYAKLTDDDVQALYVFFMQGVKPASQPNEPSDIPWPLNMRWPLAFWNLVFAPSEVYQPRADQDAVWNRGAYLVQAAGHCGACHTPRSLAMNEKSYDQDHASFLSGALLDGWYAPSLRQDHNTGLGRWSEDDIFAFLKNGRNQHSVVFGSMTEAYNNSLQFMADDDLRAMAHYLKTLPAGSADDAPQWQYQETTAQGPGAQIYAARCSFCHGTDGRGQAPWISPLAGSAASLTQHSQSQINVTLNGSMRVVTAGIPDTYRMPPFREHLNDREVADVLTYLRGAWGNHGGAVSAEDVAKLREDTDPASIQPMVLQMR